MVSPTDNYMRTRSSPGIETIGIRLVITVAIVVPLNPKKSDEQTVSPVELTQNHDKKR